MRNVTAAERATLEKLRDHAFRNASANGKAATRMRGMALDLRVNIEGYFPIWNLDVMELQKRPIDKIFLEAASQILGVPKQIFKRATYEDGRTRLIWMGERVRVVPVKKMPRSLKRRK